VTTGSQLGRARAGREAGTRAPQRTDRRNVSSSSSTRCPPETRDRGLRNLSGSLGLCRGVKQGVTLPNYITDWLFLHFRQFPAKKIGGGFLHRGVQPSVDTTEGGSRGWERGEAEGRAALKNVEVVAYRERTGVSQGDWVPPGGLRGVRSVHRTAGTYRCLTPRKNNTDRLFCNFERLLAKELGGG
jgi:hypothetical protein